MPILTMREYFVGGLFQKSKKTTETVLNTTQITKNVSEQLQQNISKIVDTTTNLQSLDVKIVIGGTMLPGCPLSMNQKATISQNVSNELMAQQLADMSTEVAKKMANNLDSELTQGSLALGESSTTDNTKITTRLENVVKRAMEQTNIAETLKNTISTTDGKLDLTINKDCAAPISVTQEVIIETAAANTIDAVVDAIMYDSELIEMTNDIASRLESKGIIGESGEFLKDAGTGLSTAFKGAGEGVGTAGKGVGEGIGTGIANAFGGGTSASIAIAIVCLIFLGVGAYFIFKK